MRFAHLHVHSEFSLLDGAARIVELVKRAAELGMKSLALTDHGVMYGSIPFYKACLTHGIKPIFGCEFYYTSGSRKEKLPRDKRPIYHLLLLAKNETGYRNLMKLSSLAHLEGFHYKPRIDGELLAKYSEGLICTSACMSGEIPRLLLLEKDEEARAAAQRYLQWFGEDFYLEIQDHHLPEQKKVMHKLIELGKELSIPLVATNDVHYINREDHALQDLLLCIGTGKTIDDPDRFKMASDQMYLKSASEMDVLFRHVPEALENTNRIAASCHVELDLERHHLPAFRPLPEGMDAAAYLRKLCLEGAALRYGSRSEEWMKRLDYELDVIHAMGFNDYFLIVQDFIRFAHENKIAVGPGRGSAAGSLVAYVLRITDVDPLQHGLLFERFLNPERISMPDIDIDFSDLRRDEVIDYVMKKYGEEHVAQIITFGTMAARAAVRDVGRALNISYALVDRVAKLIPGAPGMTIERALKENNELNQLIREQAEVRRLIEWARQIEGFPRHASTHAAGVVIAGEPLTHFTPLQGGGHGETALTQYSMEHLESLGLLKMDFLGLRTLSIIERAEEWIKNISYGTAMDDPKTYEMLGRGDTSGVFQLESPGMRRVLKELRPSNFEDIVSVLALYRPGPMEFIPDYIAGKAGKRKVSYPHPNLVNVLEETYGIIVYQEQIMQIASIMAGFSLGQADLLRRAVSKKKRQLLNEQRTFFVQGSLRQGYTEEVANQVYDLIVRFADYGFPKAHATAYGVLAYRTAFLKANWPVAFMASCLTAVMGNQTKTAEYVEECRKMGIALLPPDINESRAEFYPVNEDGVIRYALSAVKNVGTIAIQAIVQARQEKPFTDILDFCQRVDLKACNKKTIEALIFSGAMDELPGHRAQLMMMLDDVWESAVQWKKEKEDLQLHLFGIEEQSQWQLEYPHAEPLPMLQQLELEKELLGMYLSGHPMDPLQSKLDLLRLQSISEFPSLPERSSVRTAGMIADVRRIMTKKGEAMAFIQLQDRVSQVELVVFPRVWKQAEDFVTKGEVVVASGYIQHQEDQVKLIAERVASPHNLSVPESEQKLFIKISEQLEGDEHLQQLKHLLKQNSMSKGMPVILYYERKRQTVALSNAFRIRPTDDLVRAIENLTGPGTARVK